LKTDSDNSIERFHVNAAIEVNSTASAHIETNTTTHQIVTKAASHEIVTNAISHQIETNTTSHQIETNETPHQIETNATIEIETNATVDEARTFHRNDSFKKAVNAEEDGDEDTKSVRFLIIFL